MAAEPPDVSSSPPTPSSPVSPLSGSAWTNPENPVDIDQENPFIPQVSASSAESMSSASDGGLRVGRPSAADALRAGFFKIDKSSRVDLTQLSRTERMRHYVNTLLSSSYFDALVGCVMLFDVVLMISDVDARGSLKELPTWMDVASNLCLLFYTVEFSFSLLVHGLKLFKRKVILVDAFVLVVGYLELCLIVADVADVSQMGVLRIVRVIRMMRLIRTARNSPALKELRRLVMMLASCLRILLWSSVFLLIVQTVWGMLAVEFLQPVMRDLIREGVWSDCDLCQTAFSSVMRANLTLFKTIVAGDSWGVLAEPMIVHDPSTGLIFFGSLLSLVFGVMNLVVAVVVDTAAEQRQKDVMSLAQDLEDEQGADLQVLSDIFRKIDEDGSGELELDELIKGAEEVPEFQSRLRVMDIDSHDLIQLFHMLDADGGGSISPEEFQHALNRWIYDSKTATRFIKYNVMKVSEEQKTIADTVRALTKKVEKSIDRMDKLGKASKSMRQSGQFVLPHGAGGSEGLGLHRSEGLHSSEGEPDSAKSKDFVMQDDSQGNVLETLTGPGRDRSSPTLREAGITKDHVVSESLEKAYQVLRESALAAAEAALQDAAAKAGLQVQSLVHTESLTIDTLLGVAPGEQGPKAGDSTSQAERIANGSASDISQSSGLSHESVRFGPRSVPFTKPEKSEDELIPDWCGPVECVHEELQEHVISTSVTSVCV